MTPRSRRIKEGLKSDDGKTLMKPFDTLVR